MVFKRLVYNGRVSDSKYVMAPNSIIKNDFWKRLFTSSFFLALTGFLALNWLCASTPLCEQQRLNQQSFVEDAQAREEGKPASWWLAKSYLDLPKAPNAVLLGSSQVGGLQAADADTLNRPVDFVRDHRSPTLERELANRIGGETEVFTAALPGAMMSDHFLITQALFSAGKLPNAVILTLSPRDFIDNSLPCAGATGPFRFFSKYVQLGQLQDVAFPDLWSRVDFGVSQGMPLRRLSSLFEIKTDEAGTTVEREKTETDAERQARYIMGGYAGNVRPGQSTINPHLPVFFVDNTLDYQKRYRNTNPPTYAVQMRFFKELLKSMHERGIRVIAVGMPLFTTNRQILPQEFWNEFHFRISSACTEYGAEWCDLSDNPDFTGDDFCDTVHLNALGGAKLAKCLAEAISVRPAMARAMIANPQDGRAIAGTKSTTIK